MNPIYSDEYCRQILHPVAPESSPTKYISPVSLKKPKRDLLNVYLFQFQNGSPQVTPTKYRPDGGDRYIPFREDEKEWTKKYSKLDMAALSDSRVKTPSSAKRNLNAMLRVGGEQPLNYPSMHQGGANNNNNGPMIYTAPSHLPPPSTPNAGNPRSAPDDSYHDLLTHRALLSNELLNESIVDIRVSFTLPPFKPGLNIF